MPLINVFTPELFNSFSTAINKSDFSKEALEQIYTSWTEIVTKELFDMLWTRYRMLYDCETTKVTIQGHHFIKKVLTNPDSELYITTSPNPSSDSYNTRKIINELGFTISNKIPFPDGLLAFVSIKPYLLRDGFYWRIVNDFSDIYQTGNLELRIVKVPNQ